MFESCRAHFVDDVSAERLGRNEAVFRRVNEEIERMNLAFAQITETMELVCECGDIQCAERFLMTLPDYERLRSDAALFAVRPGHDIEAIESVVEERPEYHVIRKRPGRPQEIAGQTDPRR